MAFRFRCRSDGCDADAALRWLLRSMPDILMPFSAMIFSPYLFRLKIISMMAIRQADA